METRKKYGELFTKQSPLTEEEQRSMLEFENFIKNSKKYAPYTSEVNKEIVMNYEHEIAFLESLASENQNENTKRAIAVGKQLRNVESIEDVKIKQEITEQKKEQELELKLQKRAGYTNASILIFVIFNLGIFLASLLLMLK